jgi:CRISPR/Cas system-associated protein endoribonuclease Cas2
MMTQKEFNNMQKLLGSIDDKFEFGKVYTMDLVKCAKSHKKVLIKVKHVNGDETCLFLSESQFNKCKLRGEKNIEDQPEKSWWTNLFD